MPFKNNFGEIKKVSIVIPIYNEEQNLPELLKRTLAVCHRLKQQYELILVDDGSVDDSINLLTDAAENSANHIIAIFLKRNYGQHAAIIAGFKQAIGDLIITLDADLQNPPEEILNLVEISNQGYDVVDTRRINRQDSWFRKMASRMMNIIISKVTGTTIGDYGCMLRAYRRNIIDSIVQYHKNSIFIPILAHTFARRTIEIDVIHAEREFGNSKYSIMKLIHLMFDLLTCLTGNTLRLLSLIGGFIVVSGCLLVLPLSVLYFIFGSIWNIGIIFILFAILFIFIGIQFIAMESLGQYIARLNNNVHIKPIYLIDKTVGIHNDTSKS